MSPADQRLPASHRDFEETAAEILAILTRQGLRSTHPRRVVARQLARYGGDGRDFSVHDLWHEVQRNEPTLGRATVYRLVELLVADGILDRVAMPEGSHRYRLCRDAHHHHHVRCNTCRRVVEIDACLPPELFAAVADSTDFAIEGHSLELFGRCGECRSEGLAE